MKIKKSLLLLFSALFVTSCSCGDPAPEEPGGDEQNPGTVEPEPTPGGDTTEDPVDEPTREKLNRIPYSVMEKLAKGTTKTTNHIADVEDITANFKFTDRTINLVSPMNSGFKSQVGYYTEFKPADPLDPSSENVTTYTYFNYLTGEEICQIEYKESTHSAPIVTNTQNSGPYFEIIETRIDNSGLYPKSYEYYQVYDFVGNKILFYRTDDENHNLQSFNHQVGGKNYYIINDRYSDLETGVAENTYHILEEVNGVYVYKDTREDYKTYFPVVTEDKVVGQPLYNWHVNSDWLTDGKTIYDKDGNFITNLPLESGNNTPKVLYTDSAVYFVYNENETNPTTGKTTYKSWAYALDLKNGDTYYTDDVNFIIQGNPKYYARNINDEVSIYYGQLVKVRFIEEDGSLSRLTYAAEIEDSLTPTKYYVYDENLFNADYYKLTGGMVAEIGSTCYTVASNGSMELIDDVGRIDSVTDDYVIVQNHDNSYRLTSHQELLTNTITGLSYDFVGKTYNGHKFLYDTQDKDGDGLINTNYNNYSSVETLRNSLSSGLIINYENYNDTISICVAGSEDVLTYSYDYDTYDDVNFSAISQVNDTQTIYGLSYTYHDKTFTSYILYTLTEDAQ